MLTVQDLTVRYGKLTIVDRVSFSVERGQWLMVVGPNGAGKSTVAGAISQTIPSGGQVLFDGRDISKMKRRELARRIGVLTQSHYVGYGFTTEEVIWQSWMGVANILPCPKLRLATAAGLTSSPASGRIPALVKSPSASSVCRPKERLEANSRIFSGPSSSPRLT